MSPERRTLFGIFWKDESLGVTEEQCFPLNAHFDMKPRRVRAWGRPGWLVGYGSTICVHHGYDIGESDRFVLLDGKKKANTFHKAKVEDI